MPLDGMLLLSWGFVQPPPASRPLLRAQAISVGAAGGAFGIATGVVAGSIAGVAPALATLLDGFKVPAEQGYAEIQVQSRLKSFLASSVGFCMCLELLVRHVSLFFLRRESNPAIDMVGSLGMLASKAWEFYAVEFGFKWRRGSFCVTGLFYIFSLFAKSFLVVMIPVRRFLLR